MKTVVDLTEELKKYFLEKDTAAKQAVEANIAPVEADASSASRAYVVGEQLFLNDVLYDVTSPISVGDAIVVNTNITIANKLSADIKSKIDDLYSKNQTLTSALTNNVNENGCKNRFVLTFEQLITASQGASGTWNGNTYTNNGVTYTCNINDAGIVESITVNGTATARSFIRLSDNRYDNVAKKYYKLFSENRYMVSGAKTLPRIIIDVNNGPSWVRTQTITEDSEITIDLTGGDNIMAYIEVTNGQTVDNVTIYPMLCLKSDYDIDSTYEPYSKTNRQLTEDSVTWDNLSEVGAVNVLENKGTTQVDATTGLTFTVNNDKSVTVSATSGTYPHTVPSAKAFIFNSDSCDNLKDGKVYRLSGCPSGGGSSSYYIAFYQSGVIDKSDQGNGYVFAKTASMTSVLTQISIKANAVLSSAITFYPMIAPVDYNGPYVPYAKTNKELTDIVTNKILLTKQSSVKATADGTKTYATLLVEAITALRSVIGNLASNERLKPIRIGIYGLFVMPIAYEIFLDKTNTSINLNFVGNIVSTNVYQTIQIQANNTGNIYIYRSDNGNIVDRGSEVPTSGHFIEIIYEIYTFI